MSDKKIKVGKKIKNIPPKIGKEKIRGVLFGDTEFSFVKEDDKNFLIIAVYNGHGDWYVRSKEPLTQEMEWKLGRLARDVYELLTDSCNKTVIKEE